MMWTVSLSCCLSEIGDHFMISFVFFVVACVAASSKVSSSSVPSRSSGVPSQSSGVPSRSSSAKARTKKKKKKKKGLVLCCVC